MVERSTFWRQIRALGYKNFHYQKRKIVQNCGLVTTPLFVCLLLKVLQTIIERELGNSRDFQCGCFCEECCDWVPTSSLLINSTDFNSSSPLQQPDPLAPPPAFEWRCFNNTPETPCSAYSSCQREDKDRCGYQYSTATQVSFCPIYKPPTWPPLVDVPLPSNRDPKLSAVVPDGAEAARLSPLNASYMLFTGSDRELTEQLQAGLLYRSRPFFTAAFAEAQRNAEAFNGAGNFSRDDPDFDLLFANYTLSYAQALSRMGVTMGTAAVNSYTLLVEPAFVPEANANDGEFASSGTVRSAIPRPTYFLAPNCSELSRLDQAALQRFSELQLNATGTAIECASLASLYRPSISAINQELFCGWGQSPCIVRDGKEYESPYSSSLDVEDGIQEFPNIIFDWSGTSDEAFNLRMLFNWTSVGNGEGGQGPPQIQRWNGALNLASNAYLRYLAGPDYEVKLVGVRDMPILPRELTLDFSSLLGPLFFLWLMQMLLPGTVSVLVSEKEEGLRMMMKMQGLRDLPYYVVHYCWTYGLYVVFMAVFAGGGSALGLTIFTETAWSLQLVIYACWGHVLVAWAFWLSSLSSAARWTVMSIFVWLFITGFVASWVVRQFIESGIDWLAKLLETIPTFGLYRVLYEMSQYSFLAAKNGSKGMQWENLSDDGNGTIYVLIVWGVEWVLFLASALLIDRHRLGWETKPLIGGPLGRWIDRRRRARLLKHAPAALQLQAKERAASEAQSGSHSTSPRRRDWGGVIGGTGVVRPVEALVNDEELEDPVRAILRTRVRIGPDGRVVPNPRPDSMEISPSTAARTRARPSELVRIDLTAPPASDSPSPPEEEPEDVAKERFRVEAQVKGGVNAPGSLAQDPVLIDSLWKVYPARGGSKPKAAVQNVSFGVQRAECFGLLGPNGAGKTTTLKMITGFHEATGGSITVEGLQVPRELQRVYELMGNCPQHDLLWAKLTAREHLTFYALLKGLDGKKLRDEVVEALRAVNLLAGGACDKCVGTYSGGMKRRLSVAISLIGSPKVVFMDEPSTGLDPASRRLLWDSIIRAKKSKAVILTTHSMEEAEALCDRIGIIVGGQMRCVGTPLELTSRLGGFHLLTITTPAHQAPDTAAFILSLCPGARCVYALAGTQKYELHGVTNLKEIFRAVEEAKGSGRLEIVDWVISRATLEDVFLKISDDFGSDSLNSA